MVTVNGVQNMGSRLTIFTALWAVARSLAACSGDCPTVQACDIRERSCQRDTAEVAACLRGGKASDVKIDVVDKDSFIDAQVTSNAESAAQRDLRNGLSLLGLMEPNDEEAVRDYWNWVGAFYSSDTDRITVLHRGTPLSAPSFVILLLHEFIHAMQHHNGGIDYEGHGATYDENLAFAAMLEGEAVLYEDLATLDGYGRDRDDVDWSGIFRQFEGREWKDARANASPYESAGHRFPYAFGGAYLNRAWRDGGNASVRKVFAAIPQSTRQVLAGYGSTAPDELPWKEDPNEVGMPVLSAEFEYVATRHLGTWLFEIWKDFWTNTSTDWNEFSDSGFAGDVLNVFRLPATGDVIVVWRLRFADARQATALQSALRLQPALTTSVSDRDVIVAVDSRGPVAQSFVDTMTWTASAPEDSTEVTPPMAPLPNEPITCRQTL